MSRRGMAGLAKIGGALTALTLATSALALQAGGPAAGGTPPASAPSGKTPTAGGGAAASGGEDVMKKGRQLFADWSCGSCHALADAGGTGHVGPSLDGDASLSKELVVNRVTNGQGAMPSFGGQMTDEEIATIADYVTRARAK